MDSEKPVQSEKQACAGAENDVADRLAAVSLESNDVSFGISAPHQPHRVGDGVPSVVPRLSADESKSECVLAAATASDTDAAAQIKFQFGAMPSAHSSNQGNSNGAAFQVGSSSAAAQTGFQFGATNSLPFQFGANNTGSTSTTFLFAAKDEPFRFESSASASAKPLSGLQFESTTSPFIFDSANSGNKPGSRFGAAASTSVRFGTDDSMKKPSQFGATNFGAPPSSGSLVPAESSSQPSLRGGSKKPVPAPTIAQNRQPNSPESQTFLSKRKGGKSATFSDRHLHETQDSDGHTPGFSFRKWELGHKLVQVAADGDLFEVRRLIHDEGVDVNSARPADVWKIHLS
jgi:hypothetical protein